MKRLVYVWPTVRLERDELGMHQDGAALSVCPNLPTDVSLKREHTAVERALVAIAESTVTVA